MRLIFTFLLITIILGSCATRGYYNSKESSYNYTEAYDLCQQLKEGYMVIQIPCFSKKLELASKLIKTEKNEGKKEKLQNQFDKDVYELKKAQKSLIKGAQKYYTFSKYLLIPDTLIQDFSNGRLDNIVIDSLGLLHSIDNFDTSAKVLYLRDHRDLDDLYVYKSNGSLPPSPFPFSSTVGTGGITSVSFSKMSNDLENNKYYHALYVLNKKLNNFSRSRPPQRN